MSIETFISRSMVDKFVEEKDRIGAGSIRAVCAFADLMQIHFEKETLSEVIEEVRSLSRLQEGQAQVNSELRIEVKRLRDIDDAMKDFDLKKERKALDDLADEGFKEVVASRQKRRHL